MKLGKVTSTDNWYSRYFRPLVNRTQPMPTQSRNFPARKAALKSFCIAITSLKNIYIYIFR